MCLLGNLRIALYLQNVMSYDLTCLDHIMEWWSGNKNKNRSGVWTEGRRDEKWARSGWVTTLDTNLDECNCFSFSLTWWRCYCIQGGFFLFVAVLCMKAAAFACVFFNWSFKSGCHTCMKGWATFPYFLSAKQTGLYSQREWDVQLQQTHSTAAQLTIHQQWAAYLQIAKFYVHGQIF